MDIVDVFTDGSCFKNRVGNSASWAVHFPHAQHLNASGRIENASNNIAELTAILKAIEISKTNNILKVRLFSDSEYAIKCVSAWLKGWKKNGWKTKSGSDVKNKDIILAIDCAISENGTEIEFVHVRAHTGGTDYAAINNDIVDKLCRERIYC
eukprot:357640-Chlamydomonas_euryale.AAC.5